MRTAAISIARYTPLLDHSHEVIEEIERVVRPWCRLGVVLHGDHGLAPVPEAFQRLIIQIDVRVFDIVLAQRVGIDGEAMILRGDLDAAAAQILDRMIAAAMSELQLVRPAAERESEQLMAEADAEERNLADELADVLLRVGDRFRIARSVGEQDAVELRVENRARIGLRGEDGDVAILPRELAEDVALHAEVVHRDAALRTGRVFIEVVLRRCAHALHEIEARHRGRIADLGDDVVDRTIGARRDHAAHRPFVADAPRESARVDALNRADVRGGEVGGERRFRVQVRRLFDRVPHDEACDLRSIALLHDVLDPVVADVRVGHHDDLKAVGRIGRDFLIAGQRSVEDDFADRIGSGAKGCAAVDGSIFENEKCGRHWARIISMAEGAEHERRASGIYCGNSGVHTLPMRAFVAAFLFTALFSLTAAAGSIDRVSPASFFAGNPEQFIAIFGTGLAGSDSTAVVFAGPAGTFRIIPNVASDTRLDVWVPVEVTLTEGRYSIDVYATDLDGTTRHLGPAFFDVVVEVIQAPPLLSIPEVVVAEAASASGAVVFFNATGVSQGGSGLSVTCDHQTGTQFPLGPTIVNCTASDSFGSASGAFTVFVTDTAPPVLSLPAPIVTGDPVVTYTASATDAIAGSVPVTCTPSSGSTF